MWIPTGVLVSCTLVATISVPAVAWTGRAGPTGQAASAGPIRASAPALAIVRADVVVRVRRVTPAGVPIGVPRPDVTMRVERQWRGGGWATVVTRVGESPATVVGLGGLESPTNPFRIARVELVDGDPRPRMFDGAGRLVRDMAPGDLAIMRAAALAPAVGSSDPAAGPPTRLLIPQEETPAARRAALVARYGSPAGRVGGHDRYLSTSPAASHEVLVEPDTALPVEIRTRLAGGSEQHTAVEYRLVTGYGRVRRLLRSELYLAGEAGRATTEVEVTHVELSSEVRP